MPRQQGIQSLEIGFAVFRHIHALGRPATLGEVAQLSGMPPSKAHRYCVSLIRTGLVQRDGRGLYAVGPYAFQLGQAPAERAHARTLAEQALLALVQEIGETAFLTTWGQTGPTVLRVEDSPRPISIRPTSRGDIPMLNSATGRVFAAYMDPRELGPLVSAEMRALRQGERLSEAEVVRRRRAFERSVAEVVRRGLARTIGERYPGLNSVSAPIFDGAGRVIFAITAFGLAASFPVAWDGPIATAVQRSAQNLTRRLGGQPPAQPRLRVVAAP